MANARRTTCLNSFASLCSQRLALCRLATYRSLHCASVAAAGANSSGGTMPLTRVFSFGSNSVAQLRARVQTKHLESEPAIVHDWVRIFCMHSRNWGGSVASLVPHKGGMVRGLVVSLNAEQLELLDEFEHGYTKTKMIATLGGADGSRTEHLHRCRTEDVIAYIAKNSSWTGPPSESYLTAIHLMLREHWDMRAETIAILGCDQSDNASPEVQVETAPGAPAMPAVVDETDVGGGGKGAVEVVGYRPEASAGAVRVVEKAAAWRHPGAKSLGLRALCVEINARLMRAPWVMPRASITIEEALLSLGVANTPHLGRSLREGVASEALRRALCAAGGEEEEVLTACRDLLGAHLVFVYGSLLTGLANHLYLASSLLLIRDAETEELFTMVSNSAEENAFPFALDLADSRPNDMPCKLKGEVFVVDDAILAKLDWLEGHPTFYCRRTVAIARCVERVWIYLLKNDDSKNYIRAMTWHHPQVLPPGDWRSFVQEQGGAKGQSGADGQDRVQCF